jgi:hypothetical protein
MLARYFVNSIKNMKLLKSLLLGAVMWFKILTSYSSRHCVVVHCEALIVGNMQIPHMISITPQLKTLAYCSSYAKKTVWIEFVTSRCNCHNISLLGTEYLELSTKWHSDLRAKEVEFLIFCIPPQVLQKHNLSSRKFLLMVDMKRGGTIYFIMENVSLV